MVGLVSILQFSRGPCGVVSRSSGLLDRGVALSSSPPLVSRCGVELASSVSSVRISLGSCHDASSVSAGFVLRICVLVSAGFVLRIGIVSLCWVRAASLYGLVTLWFSKRRRETGIRTLKRRRETKIHTLKRRRETRVRAD
ncbi:unnamed protein product [Brassica rapa subsp. trilocularis]